MKTNIKTDGGAMEESQEVLHLTAWQILGLQMIVAEIGVLTNKSIPLTKESFKKRRPSLERLKNMLNQAVTGYEVIQKYRREERPFNEAFSFNDAVSAEKAYKMVNNLLLSQEDAAKNSAEKSALFQKIAGICERFFLTGHCLADDRKFLNNFCGKASDRLEFVYPIINRGIPGEGVIQCRPD